MTAPTVQVRRNSGLYGYERALKRVGLDPVAGADEAGRGACAGPLVAAAAILSDAKSRQISLLRDSKLLSARRSGSGRTPRSPRKAIAWSVVVIEPGECDRLGMHVANVLALRRALLRLEVPPTYVLTDGFGVDGLGRARAGGLEGRPGRRLRRRGVDHRQGDPGPDHVRAGRGLPGVRVRDPQGLLHELHQERLDRVRAVGHPPDAVRQRVPNG